MGGAKGLGLSAAASLAQEGVKVALVGRDSATGTTTAQTVPGAVFLEGDLGDKGFRQGVPAMAAQALAGAISILITNAGGPPTGEFHETPLSKWRAAFELNLFGHVEITQLLVPGMAERGFGRVVNITSFVAKEPYPNMSLSNSVRVALHGAMASLSKEVASLGVTINNSFSSSKGRSAMNGPMPDVARITAIENPANGCNPSLGRSSKHGHEKPVTKHPGMAVVYSNESLVRGRIQG